LNSKLSAKDNNVVIEEIKEEEKPGKGCINRILEYLSIAIFKYSKTFFLLQTILYGFLLFFTYKQGLYK
jgi:hypothetical protein